MRVCVCGGVRSTGDIFNGNPLKYGRAKSIKDPLRTEYDMGRHRPWWGLNGDLGTSSDTPPSLRGTGCCREALVVMECRELES